LNPFRVRRAYFEPPREFAAQANISKDQFDELNASADKDSPGFWAKLAKDEVLWHKLFSKSLDESNAPFYKWFEDGELNVSYNCLDRNLENGNADKIAIIFEADDGAVTRVTYRISTIASAASPTPQVAGIKKGDRVIVYMPMSIEGIVAMQACARIGATHSSFSAAFPRSRCRKRIIDAGATAVITADEQARGGSTFRSRRSSTKRWHSAAARRSAAFIVYKRTGGKIASRPPATGAPRPPIRQCAGVGCSRPVRASHVAGGRERDLAARALVDDDAADRLAAAECQRFVDDRLERKVLAAARLLVCRDHGGGAGVDDPLLQRTSRKSRRKRPSAWRRLRAHACIATMPSIDIGI